MNAVKEKLFRFLTYNIKMLPGLAGKGSDDEKRAKRITKKIKEMNYDIICFQELFDEDARDIISKKLKETYPHQIKKADDGSIFYQDSGLFIASKFPFYKGKRAYQFKEYEECDGWDCIAEKGILATHFDIKRIKAGHSLIVFNTHFQSDYDWVGQNEATRHKQLKQCRKFIAKILNRLPKTERRRTVALLAGDFNIDGSTQEWSGIFKILEYPRDMFNELHDVSEEHGYTWDYLQNKNMIPKTDKDQLRLDYIFALDNIPVKDEDGEWGIAPLKAGSCEIQHFGTNRDHRLSDHFALEATLAIEPLPLDGSQANRPPIV